MLNSVKIMLTAVLALFLILNFSQADIFMKQKTQSQGASMPGMSQENEEEIQTIWVAENRLRSDEGDHSVIMLLDKKKMYMLDHDKKTYTEMPMNVGEMMDSKMQDAMAGEDMSPEEKAMMQSMMKGATDIKVTVTPTSERKKIGEWNCRKYMQEMKTMMGPTTSEIWATEELKVDYDVYEKFMGAMGAAEGSFGNMMSSMAEEMKKIKGVPVLTTTTINMMGTTMSSITELIEFKEASAPKGTFSIPSGYKKTKDMQF
jgi:uncharacterized membrane protein